RTCVESAAFVCRYWHAGKAKTQISEITRATRFVSISNVSLLVGAVITSIATSPQDAFFYFRAFPEIGRSRVHDLRPGLRSFSIDACVVFYRIKRDETLILRVLHGSRDIEELL